MNECVRGFTLVEAATAIGITALLCGMMAPMGPRLLNRHREKETRMRLRMALEGMFGAKDRRVANMGADFGYYPDLARFVDQPGLSVLLDPDLYRAPPWGFHPDVLARGQALHCAWGFRGPYWSGPTNHVGDPVDAWGRRIELEVMGPDAFRLRSRGPSGRAGAQDNIYYPVESVTLGSYKCQLIISLEALDSRTPFTGTCYVCQPRQNRITDSGPQDFDTRREHSIVWGELRPGITEARIHLNPQGALPERDCYFLIDMPPGQSKQLKVVL